MGTAMDFGPGIAIDDPGEFDGQFESLLEQGIDSDQTDELRELVDGSGTVVYLFDNCGEGVFDTLLMREIRRMGKRVVGVVRGAPILNDITAEDARRAHLDRDMDRMLTTMVGRHPGAQPVAVFQADCLARGRRLFNRVMKEGLVHRIQAPFATSGAVPPWFGMYGFGEYARLGGRNAYHNYTTALAALYRTTQGHGA